MNIDQTRSDFDQMEYPSDAFLELTYLIQTRKIPNALLFHGNANTGKKDAAFMLAKGCNCNSDRDLFCGICRSCRKIENNSHPDMIWIEPEAGKKIITISQIRDLMSILSSRPNEAKYRMVLIFDAGSMNTQAQNALLKILEEPPESTFFILMADRIDLLLLTITSRCRKIRFRPLSSKLAAKRLITEFDIDPELAHIVSQTMGGDLKKSLTCLNLNKDGASDHWLQKRKWLLESIIDIIETGMDDLSKGLILSQKLSLEPDFIGDAETIMKTFFRDLMIFKFHPLKLVNLDFLDSFSHISRMVPHNKNFEWLNGLHAAEKKIEANCGLRLTLDSFFFTIAGNTREICV